MSARNALHMLPQVLANALYAAGKLQLQPPERDPALLPALLAASRLRLSAFTPQVWIQPGAHNPSVTRWTEIHTPTHTRTHTRAAFYVASAYHSRYMLPPPQALANSIWALARLGVAPDARWMSGLIEEAFVKIALFNPQAGDLLHHAADHFFL